MADIVAAKMQVFNVQNTSLLQCDAHHIDALATVGNGTVSALLSWLPVLTDALQFARITHPNPWHKTFERKPCNQHVKLASCSGTDSQPRRAL